ncbi:hypothetical protein [Kribbella sp. VKM Ac-2568]|uniref:Gfo/Idh/MocA family protein n=1 Tax=Kribbella sp. VKM Ac-2568 TaxID=2512219 RepID=UPI001043B647|nr:hypothetical protein [Kribbella sp. VKM Ac-2568]TCM46814.1 hypothetical protein EV648_105292 [Kribbella sp. VKM Ac-2568]
MIEHVVPFRQVDLRRLAADARLGRPIAATCTSLWFRPDAYFGARRAGEAEYGTVRQVELLLSVLGDWTEVVAVATRRTRRTAIEELTAALVVFADGTIATVLNSLLAAREVGWFRFDFEHATVEIDQQQGICKLNATAGREQPVVQAWTESVSTSTATEEVEAVDRTAGHELLAALREAARTGRSVRRGESRDENAFTATG